MVATAGTLLRLTTRSLCTLSKLPRENVCQFSRFKFQRLLHVSANVGMKYTKEHEWITEKGGVGRVGVTEYAQEQLGEVVYVELPEVGREVDQGETVGALESVKAASDLLTPVSGEITEVNEALNESPELINKSPLADGWIYDIKLSNPSELDGLLTADEYNQFLKDSEES